MQLPVEILDHIFGFLRVSHQETLLTCSKDPVLSLVVKKHLYYHIIVDTDDTIDSESRANYIFDPDCLLKLVSEDPRILHQVRILQIQVGFTPLDKFSSTLLMFPVLECIRLIAPNGLFTLYGLFRDALKDRLGLPTVREVHITGCPRFPFSILGNGKNIESLSLSGYFNNAIPFSEFYTSSPPLPQLKTLRLFTPYIHPWIKFHVNRLRSLKCCLSSGEDLSKLLRVCSETLKTLDLDIIHSQCKV